ncbi:MAG: DNA gyrase modulator, partial [Pseudomonadota bacterium]
MTDIALLDDLFFNRTGMDKSKAQAITGDALHNMDDGELFLEYSQSESFSFDDGQLKNASFNNNQGFGLRSVLGEAVGYSYSSELSEDAIKRAAKTVKAVNYGQPSFKGEDQTVFGSNRPLYSDVNPLGEVEFAVKIQTLQAIDSYLRSKDSRVRQVSASLLANWQAVKIIRGDGKVTGDIRPLV